MRKTGKKVVWGISYTVRGNRDDFWSKEWTGPMGIYSLSILDEIIPASNRRIFEGRPFFFRTRQQARDAIEAKAGAKWTVKYRVDKYELSWKLM